MRYGFSNAMRIQGFNDGLLCCHEIAGQDPLSRFAPRGSMPAMTMRGEADEAASSRHIKALHNRMQCVGLAC